MSKVPPTYGDLGKSARDLFDKGYNYGTRKVDFKTKSASGVEFTVKGSSPSGSGSFKGTLETKYKRPSSGVTFTEKWSTDNVLSSELAVEDQLAKGLKNTLCTSWSPSTGKRSGTFKTAYKRDYAHVNFDTDLSLSGPLVQASAVFGCENWLAGFQYAFDVSKSQATKANLAVGYTDNDIQLLTSVVDLCEFHGSVFQQINKDLSTGIQLNWTSGQSNNGFAVATKYNCSAEGTVNAKVNNQGQIGFGYTHKLRDGVKLNLSTLLEGKNFSAGGHQVGLGLEFEV